MEAAQVCDELSNDDCVLVLTIFPAWSAGCTNLEIAIVTPPSSS